MWKYFHFMFLMNSTPGSGPTPFVYIHKSEVVIFGVLWLCIQTYQFKFKKNNNNNIKNKHIKHASVILSYSLNSSVVVVGEEGCFVWYFCCCFCCWGFLYLFFVPRFNFMIVGFWRNNTKKPTKIYSFINYLVLPFFVVVISLLIDALLCMEISLNSSIGFVSAINLLKSIFYSSDWINLW